MLQIVLHVLEAEEGHAACAVCYSSMEGVCDVRDVCLRLKAVLDALEMLEGMRRVRLCRYGRCLEVPKVLEVVRCVQLCMLEAVEGRLCLLEVLGCSRC